MTTEANHSVTIHRGRVFRLVRESITLPNGVDVELDVIRHPGAAAVVALHTDGRIRMVRQFRHAVAGHIWEIPAGTLENEETPLACAKRELAEEAGVAADSWRRLGAIVPVPGYSDERVHIFLASDLKPAPQNLDRDELLDVHDLPFADALDMIRKGDIQDAKTISGLALASHFLTNR